MDLRQCLLQTPPHRPVESDNSTEQLHPGVHTELPHAQLSVVSVVANPIIYGPGAREFYIVCPCGWCSTPHYDQPVDPRCEACDVRDDGKTNFLDFIRAASQFGYRVEG